MRAVLLMLLAGVQLGVVACMEHSYNLSPSVRHELQVMYMEKAKDYSITELDEECRLFASADPGTARGVWYAVVRSQLESRIPLYIIADRDCRVGVRDLMGSALQSIAGESKIKGYN